MKAIIILPGTNKFSPSRQGDFVWSYKHNAHIWGGRELDDEEFNRVVDHVLDGSTQYAHRPIVRLVPDPVPEPMSEAAQVAAAFDKPIDELVVPFLPVRRAKRKHTTPSP